MRWIVLLASLFSGANAVAAQCPLLSANAAAPTDTTESDSFIVTYRFEPALPTVAEHFKLLGRICRKDDKVFEGTVKIDATMPHHGHGMNYVPVVALLPQGEFAANGFLLHMPGHWAFAIRISDGALREQVNFGHQAK